jgi:GWxTD domain-containing protein
VDQTWITSPEAYFVSAEELQQWDHQVFSPADAQKFVDEYWQKRGEQFRKEVAARIKFADSKFGLAKVPGSQTAMGRVWMILGSPNEQRTNRTGTTEATAAGDSPFNGRMQDNTLERAARVSYRWLYRKDRLPAGLGVSELAVNFETDVSRGFQDISNPGLVEPYLRRAARWVSIKYGTPQPKPAAAAAAPLLVPAVPDPLWNAAPALNGAFYTAEAFVSPRDDPFYAVSFFLPKGAAGFADRKSATLVSLIRDAEGKEVVAQHQSVDLETYDAGGDRFVDRSFALPPGQYEGMFALYDGQAMLAGQREQFQVPDAKAARVSRLYLTSRIDTMEKQEALAPFTFLAQKYAIRGDRRFKTTDKIGFFTVIENPNGSPNPELMHKMTFTRDGKPSFKTPLEPAQVTQTGPNSFLEGVTFDPGTFKPGHYTLQLQLRDFKAPEGSDLRNKGYMLNTEFDVVP